MIIRHQGCTGITLFRWGRRKLELWLIPEMHYIQPHIHQYIDSTLIFIWGYMYGNIAGRGGMVGERGDFLRRFTIPAGVVHSARTFRFTLFANWERWKDGAPITSAATDFTAL